MENVQAQRCERSLSKACDRGPGAGRRGADRLAEANEASDEKVKRLEKASGVKSQLDEASQRMRSGKMHL